MSSPKTNKKPDLNYEDLKAEIESLSRQETHVIVSKSNAFMTVISTKQTFKLRHEQALHHLAKGLPCDIDEVPDFIRFALEDLTEYALEHINVKEYQRHRKLLQGVAEFFEEFFWETKERPKI